MDIEFVAYCLSRLTDSQFALYCVLRSLRGQILTLSEIAELMGRSAGNPDRLRHHLRNLERKGFIRYYARGGFGHEILWVRMDAVEKAPSIELTRRKACEYRLVHPEHGSKKLLHGNIRDFARRNGLQYRALRSVLSGDRNHHHGWKLG